MTAQMYDPLVYHENFPKAVPGMLVDAAPPDGDVPLIFLAGAIKFWWLSRCKQCGLVGEDKQRGGAFNGFCPEGPYDLHLPNAFWSSPDHRAYLEHRDMVREVAIELGYLTYAPHEAFKGQWTERAQAVNDAAIRASNVMINMSPSFACGVVVITDGTDDEIITAREAGVPVEFIPPGPRRQRVAKMLKAAVE